MAAGPGENKGLHDLLEVGTNFLRCLETLSHVEADDIQIATAPKHPVLQQDRMTLFRYDRADTGPAPIGPVLIVYGLIGRPWMIDLQEDRSLVRNLLADNVDLFVVDWGHPTRADQYLTIDDYVDWYLDDCVDQICQATGASAVTLLGICEGGVFSTLYAARHPQKVRNLILTVTPIDFHGDLKDADPSHGFVNLWTRNLADEDIEGLIGTYGNLPGEIMAAVFLAMTPLKTLTKYNRDLLDLAADEPRMLNFLRMEKWLADRPHHPGAAARQWLIDLYKENRLVRGTFEISGARIDLGSLTLPILNIYAQHDHIVPPPCSTALAGLVGSTDYTELALPCGHIGVFVGEKSQSVVQRGIVDWLRVRP
ncbi:class III poly(R)-hydroxyalkanoic acid synthase subunit PhaC [Pseudoruegeria sp. SK021]|nr:class III poly(R)-hydroxyalkanoic acid synthase subunit PhaC [Pseudoruegeria sp. SK021]